VTVLERLAAALTELAKTDVQLERPNEAEHGDYATNVALQLAKAAGVAPRTVAELVAARLRETPGVDSVDIAGPASSTSGWPARRSARSPGRSWRRAPRTGPPTP
jgi:arginyl-tRNA synthetase